MQHRRRSFDSRFATTAAQGQQHNGSTTDSRRNRSSTWHYHLNDGDYITVPPPPQFPRRWRNLGDNKETDKAAYSVVGPKHRLL